MRSARVLLTGLMVVGVLAGSAAVLAQDVQSFVDVPVDHEAHDAIEWAVGVGLTKGYTDGSFKPERPLSKGHAVVFMERYYDEILGADESADFTRADMMQVLYEIAGKPGGWKPGGWKLWDSGQSDQVTLHMSAYVIADNPEFKLWVSCREFADDPKGKHLAVDLRLPDDNAGVVPAIRHRFSIEGEFVESRWELAPDIPVPFAVLQGDVDAWVGRLSETTTLELAVQDTDSPDAARVVFEWSGSFVVDRLRDTCQAVPTRTLQGFLDVPVDHEADDAIEWAAEVGVTRGYTDGSFKPERPLSKGHAVVFMERYYDEILGADESADFTRADMMVLLKSINDGGVGGLVLTTPIWLPRPEGRVIDGRCAHLVAVGIYQWEGCAWDGVEHTWITLPEAYTLAARVWAETMAPNKPQDPPDIVIEKCGDTWGGGCYSDVHYTISLSKEFTVKTVLHELAHALVGVDRKNYPCDPWTEFTPKGCVHGSLFRCAADALYVRYGGTAPSGVCGELPSE